jgi:hypothetical protein
MRFVIFGWQHAFFTSFTGIGLAVARLNHNPLVRITAPLLGLSISIFAHSLHNSLLTFLEGFAGLAAAMFVAWTGWLAMFIFILYLIYREKAWLAEYLREEVELKTITSEQYKTVCSFFGQTQARLLAITSGRYWKRMRFYQLCGELSHKKRQLALMGDENGNRQWVERLRAELSGISQVI